MDKASERKKDSKSCGDTDIGVKDNGGGGKREQLDGLWAVTSKEVVGLPPSRILTNKYCKEDTSAKVDLFEEIMDGAPPLLNISKPHRVF